ncbi:transcription-repair coupling factor [Pectinatus frisingensis]|uniref:transcription-repair coupling factor n=1 Tax=Pectinatus frisingensis TaxID=865 RepID=UPI0018C74C03|nr:transcription-repair coupling factor [Pectinatus frisingensis]
MNIIFDKISTDPTVKKILSSYGRDKGQSYIYGISGTQKHVIAADCYLQKPKMTVIICSSNEAVESWLDDLAGLLPNDKIVELPALDVVSVSATAKSMELTGKRMEILGRLTHQEDSLVVIANAASTVQKNLSKADFDKYSLQVKIGAEIEREDLLQNLVKLGYESIEQVEHMGQFSQRGGIVDVFPINAAEPFRIEFFDNTIESIRVFSLESQRSVKNISTVTIMPLAPTGESNEKAVFLSYLPKNSVVLIDEPLRIREDISAMVRETPEIKDEIFSWDDIVAAASKNNILYYSLMLQKIPAAEPDEMISMTVKAVAPFQKQIKLLCDELNNWLEDKNDIIIVMDDEQKAEYMHDILNQHKIPANFSRSGKLTKGLVCIVTGSLSNGFEFPNAHTVIITEKDIMGRQKKRSIARPANKGEKITHFRDINVGDYVVHINHGIGKYLGVKTITVNGIHRDYLNIKYGGDDKLFVPIDQVHLLQKYIGSEGDVPHLSKMDGIAWNKAKAKAKASVERIAKELVELYASRKSSKGYAFPPDTPWQQEFEEAFPYEETPDQLAAVKEIKADMEQEKVMDRLLCGDVGFGKTEVAMRAAFKAAMDGKQVAVLVPTTVLAQQHFQTFSARFEGFLPTVDVICRFRTPKEQKNTLEKLAAGQIDILIGTHSILNSKKVKFSNLGLLIVDEEQRFGVKQKEKIKKMSKNIDVLTLSATPIPRTLHMSLVGARDMSVIETPPKERFSIQTYVIENNDTIISDAIRREMRRGGQVYFIYNRVESIDKMYLKLTDMLPEARIKVAHGQMSEILLEKAMMDFYEGKYDVLLATSIIENGLDIANANTIIIYDADRFGLSQLYQMRGRVGRSKNMAFAYFVYQRDKVLTETAEKRLQAIKDFAELGSGFKIAMRDLEIRGAGNLLGAQQHGHVASVGFEMYCRLLEEAVAQLGSGKNIEIQEEPLIEIKVDAYIDGEYIDDAMHKMEIYQRIAALRNDTQLLNLKEDMEDRFGKLTLPVANLLQIAGIKNLARDMGIKSIVEKNDRVEFTLLPDHKIKAENLLLMRKYLGGLIKFQNEHNCVQLKLTQKTLDNPLAIIIRTLKRMAGIAA